MRKSLLLFAALALSLTALLSADTPNTRSSASPARKNDKLHKKGAKAIPGHYIVVYEDYAAGEAGDFSQADQLTDVVASAYNVKVNRRFNKAVNGFAGEMTEAEALALSEDPRVRFVEEDQVVSINATQSGATWGLDRVDQRNRPLNGTYNFNWTGSGVRAYIIDTGIRTAHTQFGGRAAVSFDAIGDGRNGQDCNGHGTHVAGTVGGSTYGVAKNVSLRAVRVLNCSGSGTTSGVISGVNWVAANRVLPAVANMSLGGGASSSLDTAVNNAIIRGVTFAVAAGNETQDACNVSPARAPSAITTGATTTTDAVASYSNFGSCVDVFAPGSNITSAWWTTSTSTNTISGTSMASPHVAGVAALYLQGNPSASPAAVTAAITGGATQGVLTGVNGSPNRLLYSLI